MIRRDYENIHGFATGIRALLKRNGIKVGSWKPSGWNKNINSFTGGGAEVRGLWDEVVISMWDEGRPGMPTLGEVRNVLSDHGIEFKEFDGDLYIPGRPYCKKVGR